MIYDIATRLIPGPITVSLIGTDCRHELPDNVIRSACDVTHTSSDREESHELNARTFTESDKGLGQDSADGVDYKRGSRARMQWGSEAYAS